MSYSFRTSLVRGNASTLVALLPLCFLLTWGEGGLRRGSVQAAETPPAKIASGPTASAHPSGAAARAEQIRAECVKGRRLVCGRVLKVVQHGLVVDSGYTDLLRPPLTRSWVVPGTVPAHRDPTALELNEPGTPCVGLVFITDFPKRQRVQKFDYVILMGYPAGQYVYTPAPGVKKTIRGFSAGLDTAVKLNLQAESARSQAPAP